MGDRVFQLAGLFVVSAIYAGANLADTYQAHNADSEQTHEAVLQLEHANDVAGTPLSSSSTVFTLVIPQKVCEAFREDNKPPQQKGPKVPALLNGTVPENAQCFQEHNIIVKAYP